ncbi:unnamed protein product [Ceutorhynchus assimilis]|uniref:Uncharacterized protein n=1 Tax=Ceutorhynchus assimilis TaxID=467358 RepID=A0A9N9QQU5_9CUCU|nr:unnamed protein product [Ceutorhynchus assimilis]
MGNEEKYKKAKIYRSVEVNRINELLTIAQNSLTDNGKHGNFKSRYEHVETVNDSFYKQHNVVLNYMPETDEEFEIQDKIRQEFDSNYYTIKAIYFQIFDDNNDSNSSTTNAVNISAGSSVHLSKLSLVSFNGDVTKFTSFIDVFDALVHANPNLTNIEKFSHLLSCLDGPPKNLIQCYQLSAANYMIAYNALQASRTTLTSSTSPLKSQLKKQVINPRTGPEQIPVSSSEISLPKDKLRKTHNEVEEIEEKRKEFSILLYNDF